MGDRSLPEPAEYVIWVAAGLLSTIVGVGAAFAAWAALHRSASGGLAEAAVTLVSIGLAIVGLAIERPMYRVCAVVFAMALMASYLLGGPEFARLLP